MASGEPQQQQPLSPLSISPTNTAIYSPPSASRLASQASSGSLRTGAIPPSPRASSRHPSMSQQSMADFLAHPPAPKQDAPERDWTLVSVKELVKDQHLMFVEMETTVEDACQVSIDA